MHHQSATPKDIISILTILNVVHLLLCHYCLARKHSSVIDSNNYLEVVSKPSIRFKIKAGDLRGGFETTFSPMVHRLQQPLQATGEE